MRNLRKFSLKCPVDTLCRQGYVWKFTKDRMYFSLEKILNPFNIIILTLPFFDIFLCWSVICVMTLLVRSIFFASFLLLQICSTNSLFIRFSLWTKTACSSRYRPFFVKNLFSAKNPSRLENWDSDRKSSRSNLKDFFVIFGLTGSSKIIGVRTSTSIWGAARISRAPPHPEHLLRLKISQNIKRCNF